MHGVNATMMTSRPQGFLGMKTMATAAGMLPVPSPFAAVPCPPHPFRVVAPARRGDESHSPSVRPSEQIEPSLCSSRRSDGMGTTIL
jgi:hypothetical protein